jgi:hypothetical protein
VSVALLMRAQKEMDNALESIGFKPSVEHSSLDVETLKKLPHHLLPKEQQELLARFGGDPMSAMRALKAKMNMLAHAEIVRKAAVVNAREEEAEAREEAFRLGKEYVAPQCENGEKCLSFCERARPAYIFI